MHRIDADDMMSALECHDAETADHRGKVELAQTALRFAIGLLTEVADATNDKHARAYMIDHLRVMAGADHGFLSREFNLDDWIEQLENGDDEEGEDGE